MLLLDFSVCLPTSDPQHESIVTTLALALQVAGAKLLQLDTREIGSMAIRTGPNDGFGAVLYDNVPGGAGHVRELYEQKRNWLEEARTRMFIDDNHHEKCEIACLDCLLTYDAQTLVQGEKLSRKLAFEALDKLLNATESMGGGTGLDTPGSSGEAFILFLAPARAQWSLNHRASGRLRVEGGRTADQSN